MPARLDPSAGQGLCIGQPPRRCHPVELQLLLLNALVLVLRNRVSLLLVLLVLVLLGTRLDLAGRRVGPAIPGLALDVCLACNQETGASVVRLLDVLLHLLALRVLVRIVVAHGVVVPLVVAGWAGAHLA